MTLRTPNDEENGGSFVTVTLPRDHETRPPNHSLSTLILHTVIYRLTVYRQNVLELVHCIVYNECLCPTIDLR